MPGHGATENCGSIAYHAIYDAVIIFPTSSRARRNLAGGGFGAQQRIAMLVGGTGTRKTHLPSECPAFTSLLVTIAANAITQNRSGKMSGRCSASPSSL
jgi:hypothetical protein